MVAENRTPNSLMAAMRHFTPDVAAAYVASIKWPDGPCCPKCGSMNVGKIASRNRLQCREKGCRKQFSLLTGTILESTHLRLDQWVLGVWMIVNCKNGVSSCEIARHLGCKQQSAWHLLHRVRHILQQENAEPLTGACEADFTYVGGSLAHMSPARKERAWARGRSYGNKAVVHALKHRRSGEIRASVIEDGSTAETKAAVVKHLKIGMGWLYTDSAASYGWAANSYVHKAVNHSAGEYVRGTVHVNGCENFFNCLRRGLKGTYIRATPEHLAAYVDEQVYRFNHRKETEWERFDGAMRQIVGKRLTYSELTDGAVR